MSSPDPLALRDDRDNTLVPHVTHAPDIGLLWPSPIVPELEFGTPAHFIIEDAAEATDGCLVAPDLICRHGYPSELLRLGTIRYDWKGRPAS